MKTISFNIILVLFAMQATAQTTNYYKETKTFQENGYTYQCDVPHVIFVTLYNKDNKLTYEHVVYKKTGKFFDSPMGKVTVIVNNPVTNRKVLSIVDDAFTLSLARRLKEEELITVMCVNTETGKVMEVYFKFTTSSPYATIPLYVYREIEMRLKNEIKFTTTELGKSLNYIMLIFERCPAGKVVINNDTSNVSVTLPPGTPPSDLTMP